MNYSVSYGKEKMNFKGLIFTTVWSKNDDSDSKFLYLFNPPISMDKK